MLALTHQILTEFGNELINKIGNNVLNYKTGNFVPRAEREAMAASLHYEIDDKGFRLYGGKYIFTYESGRGPTVNPGNGAVRRNVLQVLKEESIVSKYNDKNGKPYDQNSLAYFISKKIHEEGTILFRENKKSGVLSDVINENTLDPLMKALFYEFEAIVTSTLLEK